MFALIIEGFQLILNPTCLLLIMLGVFVGIVFGAIPGLTSATAVALFLPITFGMSPVEGVALLIALYIGGISGGLISAILLKIPGTPSSVATCFDGHPMAANGQASRALGVGILYSFLGTAFSWLALIFIAPIVADFAVKFGTPELFALAIFSLTMVSSLASGTSIYKSLIACLFGIAITTVGMAPIDGAFRFTFGFHQLDAGIDKLPILLGFFAVAQTLEAAEKVGREEKIEVVGRLDQKVKGFGISIKEFKEQFVNMIRSALIGTGIGILPGIGSGTSNVVSYMASRNSSKHPEKYGTGIIDGLIASETANNASVGGALIPMLTLGIPGDNVTAILLGGLIIHNITPGPLLFQANAGFVYSVFATVLVASIVMLLMEFYGIKIFVKLLSVPTYILLPIVLSLCVVGTFGLNSRMFDVACIVVFGVIGYIFKKCKFPITPVVMGFVLGDLAETNLLRGLMLYKGSFWPFLTRPVTLIFLIISACSIGFSVYKNIKASKRKTAGVAFETGVE